MTVTYKVAVAAGRDAGTRSMRAAGRTQWNEEDWSAAAAVTARLMEVLGVAFPTGEVA